MEHSRSKKSKQERIEIERAALKIYDRLNPNWKFQIKISKADCIKMAEMRLRRRASCINA